MRFLTPVALALVMLWVPVDGVAQEEQERNPLRGLSKIHPQVSVIWHDPIQSNEAVFRQETERAFELGLLRTGILLSAGGTLGGAITDTIH